MIDLNIPENLDKNYEFVGGRTYARGIHNLQKACEEDSLNLQPTFITSNGETIYRPLTLLEQMQEVVVDFNTFRGEHGKERSLEDRERLLNKNPRGYIDTCTGILNKAESAEFKLILQSEDLITIEKNFKGYFLPVPYNSVEGISLDNRKGVYGQRLKQDQVPEHPFWRAVSGETQAGLDILNGFAGIAFARILRKWHGDTGMGVYLRQNTLSDELRALFVSNLNNNSNANGYNNLNDNASFLRAAQIVTPEARLEGLGRLSLVNPAEAGNLSLAAGEDGLCAIVSEGELNPSEEQAKKSLWKRIFDR